MFSDIQGRYSAQRHLDWVQAMTSVETANVGKVFIIERRAPMAELEKKKQTKNLRVSELFTGFIENH